MAHKRSIRQLSSSPQHKRRKLDPAVDMLLSQNRSLKFFESRRMQIVDVMGKKASQSVQLRHGGRPMLLIFSSEPFNSSAGESYFQDLLQAARTVSKFATVAVVSKHKSGDLFGLHHIEDFEGHIARECGVLDPLGGGRIPLDCLVIIDSNQRQRAVVPLGARYRGLPFDVVVESLRSLI